MERLSVLDSGMVSRFNRAVRRQSLTHPLSQTTLDKRSPLPHQLVTSLSSTSPPRCASCISFAPLTRAPSAVSSGSPVSL